MIRNFARKLQLLSLGHLVGADDGNSEEAQDYEKWLRYNGF